MEEEDILTIKVKPQFIPFKCPVCSGFGTVNYGKIVCKACGGEGFLKVPLQEEGEIKDDKS